VSIPFNATFEYSYNRERWAGFRDCQAPLTAWPVLLTIQNENDEVIVIRRCMQRMRRKVRAAAAAAAVAATYQNDVKMANDRKCAAVASCVILAVCGRNW